jgi:cytochrome c oxidase cbb3-type subunit 4
MDLNDLRSAVTLLAFGLFVALLAWAFSARRRAGFDQAAHLPLADETDSPGAPR